MVWEGEGRPEEVGVSEGGLHATEKKCEDKELTSLIQEHTQQVLGQHRSSPRYYRYHQL